MKTLKLALALFTAGLLLNSCGRLSPKKVTEMPGGADFQQVYDKLVEILKVEPMLYELEGTFKEGPSGSSSSAYFYAIVSVPDNKGLYKYGYNIADAIWSGPDEVTLHVSTGRGGSASVAYDEFKEYLFNRSDFPPFSMFDELYVKAIEVSGFGKDNCYVEGFKAETTEEGKGFNILVRPNDEKAFIKEVWFDSKGNVTNIVEYDNN